MSTDDLTPESTETTTATAGTGTVNREARKGTWLGRLSTGTGAFDILGHRRWYYGVSLALVLLSLVFILIRGFNFGIDFAGGTRFTFEIPPGQTFSQVENRANEIFTETAGVGTETVQQIGASQIQLSSVTLEPAQVTAVKDALQAEFQPNGGVSDAAVSNTWGAEISQRALIAVIVFLVLVAVYLWIRYEQRVAFGAVVSTIHDLVLTAGIYSAIGFEVTPATVIGLLTILGFSLYDTVVVYDKVQENTKGLLSQSRRTYQEAANLAVNQTLMRSINTSLIAALPVIGLLVAGVAILGSGTLKDLALVILTGMLVGAYSSVFLAVPLAVDLKQREKQIQAHTARVKARRRNEGLEVDADGEPIALHGVALEKRTASLASQEAARTVSTLATKPQVGVKPVKPTAAKAAPSGKASRPTGKSTRQR